MKNLFVSRRLLVLFFLLLVSGFVVVIIRNDDSSNDDDGHDDTRSIVVRRSSVASDNGTANGNCSSMELRNQMKDYLGMLRDLGRLSPGSRARRQLSRRLSESLGRLLNCSESMGKEELSLHSLTALCHAQCTANCADLDEDCRDPNCTLYTTGSWVSLCDKDDYDCLKSCSQNETRSAESPGPVPKKPTTLALLQVNPTLIRITWSTSEVQSQENTVVYVTESMSVTSDWTVIKQSTENWTEVTVGVCAVVAFRVAAVNQFGCDGFSAPIVRTDLPAPGMIIDADNDSLKFENGYFHYQFKFYTPEYWDDAIPNHHFPNKTCPPSPNLPPQPESGGFKKIEERTYIYKAKVPSAGYKCVYTLQINLVSSCGIKGPPYTTYINLTEIPWIPGSTQTPRSSTVRIPATTTSPDGLFTSEGPVESASSSDVVYVSVGVAVAVVVVLLLLTVGCVAYRRRTAKTGGLSVVRLQEPLHELKAKNCLYKSPDNYIELIGREDWEISRDSIVLGQVLGQGAFGQVRKAVLGINDDFLKSRCHLVENANIESKEMTVAVKMLIGEHSDLYRADFLREIELMRSIGYHGNVVSMIGCCTRDDPLCLVVEHVALGDLLNYLQGYRAGCQQLQANDETNFQFLTILDLMNFAQQIVLGMEFLAKKGFVHRDLAARNVLVGEGKRAKIGDFGLTRYIYDDQVYVTSRGGKLPLKWMAVESIFDLTFTSASDVWSFGIVLYELVTLGGTPYPTINHRDLLRELQRGYRLERPAANCSLDLYQLMLDCWQTQPKKRPTFTQLSRRIETMRNSMENTPESLAKVLPIDGSAYQDCNPQRSDDSGSRNEARVSEGRVDQSPSVTSQDLAKNSVTLSNSSNFDSGIILKTSVDYDNAVFENDDIMNISSEISESY